MKKLAGFAALALAAAVLWQRRRAAAQARADVWSAATDKLS